MLSQRQTSNTSRSALVSQQRGYGLCILSAFWCSEKPFWDFLEHHHGKEVTNAAGAAQVIRDVCSIESRKQLDTDARAAQQFNLNFRQPYMTWIKANKAKESHHNAT